MGPKKPRRANLNEVLREYQMFKQLNEDVPERSEPHNICLETCFTTFPEQHFNNLPTIATEPVLETTNYRHKQKDNRNLAILDRNKNVDMLNAREYSSRRLCDVAPLAQPENFSDTSSNTSSTNNADSIIHSSWARQMDNIPSPSILKAPQMMRRTPKIIGNLSTCTDDIRNVKSFEKLVKSGNTLLDNSNSSSNVSYGSGVSNRTNCSNDYEHFVGVGQCSWQREQPNLKQWEVENVSCASKTSILAEELLEEILEYADCADFFKSDSSFLDGYDERLFDTESETNCDTDMGLKIPTIRLTKSTNPATNSPLILSPCSLEIDPDLISNFAIDLNLEQEHRSLLSHQNLQSSILKVSNIGLYNDSHTPPCAKTVTFSPDVLSIDDRELLQECSDHLSIKRQRSRFWSFMPFRYFNRKVRETTSSLPNISKTENVSTIYANIENRRSIDQLLTKNEALPLLNAARGDNNEQFYSNIFNKGKACINSEV